MGNVDEGGQDLLWRYTDTDMVAVLYPTCAVNESTSTTSRAKIAKRNLRTGDRYSYTEEDAVSTNSASSVSGQLVPVWQTTNSNNKVNRPDLLSPEAMLGASSRVLMTQGLANLDPSFAHKPLFLDVMRRASNTASASSSEDLTEDTITPRIVSETNERSESATSPSSDSHSASSLVPVVSTYSHAHSHQQTQGPTDSKELVMLIPASSVRFGIDANGDKLDDSSLQSLLRQHIEKMNRENDTTDSRRYTTSTLENEDENDLWVEIGCSVLSAKLVRNPALTTTKSAL